MAGEEVAVGLLALAGLAVLALSQIPEPKSLEEEGQEERSARSAEKEIAREEVLPRQGPVGTAQPVTKEIYREREIIREIVKIRCRNCGSLFEEKLNSCPRCGAPPGFELSSSLLPLGLAFFDFSRTEQEAFAYCPDWQVLEVVKDWVSYNIVDRGTIGYVQLPSTDLPVQHEAWSV